MKAQGAGAQALVQLALRANTRRGGNGGGTPGTALNGTTSERTDRVESSASLDHGLSTVTTAGAHTVTLHQGGAFSDFDYALASVLYQESATYSTSFSETGGAAASGTSLSTSAATLTQGGSTALTGSLLSRSDSGLQTTVESSTDSHHFTSAETYTRTGGSLGTASAWQEGTFLGGLYVLETGQDQSSAQSFTFAETSLATLTGAGTRRGTTTGSSGASGLWSALIQLNPMSDSGSGAHTTSFTETFTYETTAGYTLTQFSAGSMSAHQAGQYSNFSVSLGCVVHDGGATGSYEYEELRVQELGGNATLAASRSGSRGGGQSAGGTELEVNQTTSSSDSASFSGASSYTATATHAHAESSNGSYHVRQEGTLAGGKYAFGTVILDQGAQATSTTHDALTRATEATAAGDADAASAMTLVVTGAQPQNNQAGTASRDGTASYALSGVQSSTLDQEGHRGHTAHRAGSFANGSFSLSCVLYDAYADSAFTFTATDSRAEDGTRVSLTTSTTAGSRGAAVLTSTAASTGTLTGPSLSTSRRDTVRAWVR